MKASLVKSLSQRIMEFPRFLAGELRLAKGGPKLSIETGTPFHVNGHGKIVDLNASKTSPVAAPASN